MFSHSKFICPSTIVARCFYRAENDGCRLSLSTYTLGDDNLSLNQQENPCMTSQLFDWQLWQTGGTLYKSINFVYNISVDWSRKHPCTLNRSPICGHLTWPNVRLFRNLKHTLWQLTFDHLFKKCIASSSWSSGAWQYLAALGGAASPFLLLSNSAGR